MQIRCPHCQHRIEIVQDSPLLDVDCPSCGSSFSLLSDSSTTRYDPSAPAKLGSFDLLEPVGTGAFGTVWKARDSELDREVAVKIPRREQLSPTETEQFLREARSAAQLKHPNIVGVHEVGREGETVYIVSDFVHGLTLSDWLSGQQPTPREAVELCRTIAAALHHAHEQGVIHRDLKPGNIILDAEQTPHLMDFGLAKREAGEITMTADGQVLGTPAYMSPEQARGEGHQADRRSDVYSLGVILFELLTGEKPFRGNTRMLLHQVLNEDAPSPRKFNAAVPRDLETICLKCLEKDPDRRYQTSQAFADDLQHWLKHEPITARPISRLERTWRWCRREPVIASLTATAAALLIVVAIVATVGYLKTTTALRLARQREQEAIRAQERERLAREEGRVAAIEREEMLLSILRSRDFGWLDALLPEDSTIIQDTCRSVVKWIQSTTNSDVIISVGPVEGPPGATVREGFRSKLIEELFAHDLLSPLPADWQVSCEFGVTTSSGIINVVLQSELTAKNSEGRAQFRLPILSAIELKEVLDAQRDNSRFLAESRGRTDDANDKLQDAMRNADGPARYKLHFLGLAADRYPGTFELKYSRKSTQAIVSALYGAGQDKRLYEIGRALTLYDSLITQQKVTSYIDQIFDSISPNDVVLVYLSGIGIEVDDEYYFIPPPQNNLISPWDTVVESETKKLAIGWPRLAVLGNTPCRVIWMLDTSNANFVTEKLSGQEDIVPGVVVAASDDLVFEGEQYRGGHSAFAASILDGLEGLADGSFGKAPNGVVTVAELVSFVKQEVYRETGRIQKPVYLPEDLSKWDSIDLVRTDRQVEADRRAEVLRREADRREEARRQATAMIFEQFEVNSEDTGLNSALNTMVDLIMVYLKDKNALQITIGEFSSPPGTNWGRLMSKLLEEKLVSRNVVVTPFSRWEIRGELQVKAEDNSTTLEIIARLINQQGVEVADFRQSIGNVIDPRSGVRRTRESRSPELD